MKALLIAAAGLLAINAIAPASAADLEVPAAKAPPIPVFNWTGLYIGGNVGGGWDNLNYSGSSPAHGTVPATTFSGVEELTGIVGGGQVGGDYQLPTTHFVFGVEADIDGSTLKGFTNGCSTNAAGVTQNCNSNSSKLDDFGTVRGRLGYAWNNVLVYGTGGWAYGNGSSNSILTCTGGSKCPGTSVPFTGGTASASSSPSGWTAGGGLEIAFLSNWIIRAEYLHLGFSGIGTNFTFTGTAGAPPVAFTATSHSSANASIDVFRLGLSYLFKL